MSTRLSVLVAVLAAALLAVLAPAAPAATIGDLSKAVADDGAKVVDETVVDARTVDLRVWSPAAKRTASVRLMLPPD